MINSIIIDTELVTRKKLSSCFLRLNSNIHISGSFSSFSESVSALSDIDLVFCNSKLFSDDELNLISNYTESKEVVCLGSEERDAYAAYRLNAIDFILKPINEAQVINVVRKIHCSFKEKHASKSEYLGIPTILGYDFVKFKEVLKCEGLQSYTRIVLKGKPDVICSYNIGEIKKLLQPRGFFAPHKSYLINLNEIDKYSKEGMIFLNDGSHVPLARRRKKAFFDRIALVK